MGIDMYWFWSGERLGVASRRTQTGICLLYLLSKTEIFGGLDDGYKASAGHIKCGIICFAEFAT